MSASVDRPLSPNRRAMSAEGAKTLVRMPAEGAKKRR
jgi:hypothetical protein